MTRHGPDPVHSTFDLELAIATDRVAARRRDERHAPAGTERHPGPLRLARTELSRGLIALGAAIAPAGSPAADRRHPRPTTGR